jgi:hypothetical protein
MEFFENIYDYVWQQKDNYPSKKRHIECRNRARAYLKRDA